VPRRLLVATTNAGKLREIRDVLRPTGIDLLTLNHLPGVAAPEEDGVTFEENARLKARYYASHSLDLTVAEDSGLVIDALDGAPGVHSARYLGESATYPERFAKILSQLAARPERPRSARFVCALALAQGNEILFETTAHIEGEIAERPAGTDGFGYDPIFLYRPYGHTLAEVTREQKLAVAHRGRAFRQLSDWLLAHPSAGVAQQS
jgi:XTP/dITP diphosphohydrolase